jgi:NAD(P)-dependent dehydrogenase (short-subunit alcohol dehydrogenase family)
MRRLEGKTILLAGCGNIGAGLARRYAREGASLVIADRDLAAASRLAEAIVAEGDTAIATQVDGADEASAKAAVACACETFGGLDGLHANFATFVDGGQDVGILELPVDHFDETIRVNLRGYYLCTRAALPAILARGGGSIVYMSSMSANLGEPTRVAYGIAKAGVQALMRHVAARYGPSGVRANCIAPGAIIQDRYLGEHDAQIKEWSLGIALLKSRLGTAEDVASVGALLLSEEGSYITGQTISVDGGSTMRL